MKKQKLYHYALCALCAAVTAVCAQITIPLPFLGVPLTLQTFAVAFAGYFLGAKKGLAAIIIYLLLGAVGVPVFSGFAGGFAVLLGKSGGFLFGFIPLAFLCGIGNKKGAVRGFLVGAAGVLACHIIGVLQFYAVYGGTLVSAFLLVSAPYLIKDFASIALAELLAKKINKKIKI